MHRLLSIARQGAPLVTWLAWFLLCMALGRLANFVTHAPLLAYGNSYDMVRIQACHQIWPAGLTVKDPQELASPTPAAPLPEYVLGLEVDTLCFPSSELLFTELAIELSQGADRIPLRAIGEVKAAALALALLAAHLLLVRRGRRAAQLAHALVALLVLTDPGVTLYLSTFYTEFSAVFFAYLTGVGLVLLGSSRVPLRDVWWLCIGIAGLALSKPQHLPLAVGLGLLVALCQVLRGDRVSWLPLLLAMFVPLHLVAQGDWMPRNDAMLEANKLNAVAAMVTATPPAARGYLLDELGLGPDCLRLENKNWYSPEVHQEQICSELAQLSHSGLVLELVQHPRLFLSLLGAGVPRLNDWVTILYGHVEGREYGNVSEFHWTLGTPLRELPAVAWQWLGGLLVCLSAALLLLGWRWPAWRGQAEFLGLAGMTAFGMFLVALLGDGFVDLAKHAHLATVLGLAFYLVLMVELLAWAAARLLHQGSGLKQG